MNPFFRRIPLPVKLMLIGIIPGIFLIYLSYQLYREKTQKVQFISDYIERIHQSGNISALMNELQTERRYSFQYALTKKTQDKILSQRHISDSIIKELENSKDLAISKFTSYTFLNNLQNIRRQLDTSKNFSADSIRQYYTTVIFRLNTLNSTAPTSNAYLQPIYQDMVAQKTLSEMITYLGVIRTNIYNVLYRREYMVETLVGTVDSYEIYKTYETEFLLKASTSSVKLYQDQKSTTALRPTINYMDRLFHTFKFDSSFEAENWWSISTAGLNVLRKLQRDLWSSVELKMNTIYNHEKNAKNRMLFFLIAALLFIGIFVAYNIKVISLMLTELKIAAQKISIGGTNLDIKNVPDDVMGSLARSILKIDENNKQLAFAADAIGKGNFKVKINPRSEDDLLGNSIERMKEDLHRFTLQKEKTQKEMMDLIKKKDEFMSIASHELKTPVTSLKAYTQILHMESINDGDKKKEVMLFKMDAQVNKLTTLINDLLDTTKYQNGQLLHVKQHFIFNLLTEEIVEEIERTITSHQVYIESDSIYEVYADRERIGQVLRNLLTNAIKYSNEHDKIILRIQKNNNKLICSVTDLGIGIAKEQQNKIFDRFFKVDGENLHTYPGLGLGLYISKEIIDRHNEKIWVESEPGKGAAFYFTLTVSNSKI